MIRPRVIPVLLLSDGKVIKTFRFRNPKYVGEPLNVLKIFNEKEVDEIIVLDIEASKRRSGPNFGLIEKMTSECFMPLAYGGGISTVEHAQTLFGLGVEKICVNSAAVEDINIIRRLADRFGSQAITAVIDIKKNWLGKKKVYSASQRDPGGASPEQRVAELVQHGAGEILLNFVDNDGIGNGYDIACTELCAAGCEVPLVALGGAGKLEHLREAIDHGASAVAAGSLFVFQGPHKAVMITYPNEAKLQQLFQGTHQ